MDQIRENERDLRNSIQQHNIYDVSVIDIFTAFNVLHNKRIDSSIADDQYFAFLLGVIDRVPRGREREFWYTNMFRIFEKLSGINVNDPNWLLLQASLIYLAPVGSSTDIQNRFQS